MSAPSDADLVGRLSEIAADSAWSPPLRVAAQWAATGDPNHRIEPASLSDADIRAALIANINWRRTLPAAVDDLDALRKQVAR